MISETSIEALAAYYESKTQAILRRYGPGPRVHYHAGLVKETGALTTVAELRSRLRESQQRMLVHAADAWRLKSVAFRNVLDVGCGLGGGAIFWAHEFGSDVTAITIAPSHVNLVATFATEAGVGSRVHPLLCDALKIRGENRFDAIVAIDSSCHLDRQAWFPRVSGLLRKGGHVFIADCFVDQEAYRAPFDRYWRARIGTVEEYLAAAQRAGLLLEHSDDVSRLVANSWATTVALIRVEAQDTSASPSESLRAHESLDVHSLMRSGLLDGGFRHMLMSFTKA